MAEASKTVVMNVPIEKIWGTIVDYEKYDQFVEGVDAVSVKNRKDGAVQVQYKIELMGKEIFYTLDHVEKKPHEMTWTLVDSNIMKGNKGGWILKDLGEGKTEVTYTLALDFKIPVPGFVLSGLVKGQLPKMLGCFEQRAKGQ